MKSFDIIDKPNVWIAAGMDVLSWAFGILISLSYSKFCLTRLYFTLSLYLGPFDLQVHLGGWEE